MFYTRLRIDCVPSLSEILIAELSQAGFDTFEETESGLDAFVEEENFDREALHEIWIKYGINKGHYSFQKVKKENWNEQWEKSITPIQIGDQCVIRAEFHSDQPGTLYNIVITPKMSFGTGHHATTYLMVKTMLGMNFKDQQVMDVGCGTSVLSILAAKMGAEKVEAFDIDEWSVINSLENVERNAVTQVSVKKGVIESLSFNQPFDIILANINKNVILSDLHVYASHMKIEGQLLLSGFYEKDIDDIILKAESFGMAGQKHDSKEDWAVLLLKKIF
ncbi:MAG: 50S ribosomal protein L11 methyltransferase [Flammeovirgaceae bacterium]|nr:50S ribosomal protein L11 methyltransferase [Flammeovirgaceae bacterium]